MEGFISKRYGQLESDRSMFLEDAYKASELTIQFLLPRNGNNKANTPAKLEKQHQSMGAMGISNLSNKLLLALFPPNQPFFKLAIDDFTALDLTGDENARDKIEQGFSAVERTTTDFVERSGIRPPFEEALKHLLVTGNILINRNHKGRIEIYHMDQYVLRRDPDGSVREIVIDEPHTWDSLPDRVKEILRAAGKEGEFINETEDGQVQDKQVSMYTRIFKYSDTRWEVTQELLGIEIPIVGPNTFTDKTNPWYALRFHAVKGSAWGRGYVQNFLGDLDTLEQLWKSFSHTAKAMAFLLFMIRPGSTVRPNDIIKKPNGGFLSANPEDVGVLQASKAGDLSAVTEAIDRITRRLSQAFLMDASITRDAERVTAAEITMLAQRLEEALGGFYSIMTQDFQVPYLNGTMAYLVRTKQIPKLPKEIKPIIITGLDALGRNSEADRLSQFSQELQAGLGPELASNLLIGPAWATRVGAARGIDTKGLIKTADQLQEEQEQAQQQAMTEQATGPGINAAAKLGAEAMKQQQPQ